jgi:hypothetical protein
LEIVGRMFTKAPGRSLLAATLVFGVWTGCKPGAEPEFPWGAPPADYPSAGLGAFSPAEVPEPVRVGGETPERPTIQVPSEATNPPATAREQSPIEAVADEPSVENPNDVLPPIPVRARPRSGDSPKPVDVEPSDVEPSEISSDEINPAAAGSGEAPAADDAAESTELPTAHQPDPPLAPQPSDIALRRITRAERDELARRVSHDDERKAARLNRQGLRHHKAGRYSFAIEAYLDALAMAPSARYPRYNLACAYALVGRADAALRHLVLLRESGNHDKLSDARVDPDFRSLRSNPSFVSLTGFTPVAVYRGPGVSRRSVTELVARITTRANLPASAPSLSPDGSPISAELRSSITRTRILRRAGFQSASEQVAALLPGAEIVAMDALWSGGAAPVVVLLASDTALDTESGTD